MYIDTNVAFLSIYIYFFKFFYWGGVSRGLRVVLVNGRLKKTFEKKIAWQGENIYIHITYNLQTNILTTRLNGLQANSVNMAYNAI